MRTRDMERFKKILLQMRQRVQQEWEAFEKENLSQNLRDQIGQISSYTTHPADMGSITDEQERAFLLASHERISIDAMDEALARIESGSFGRCKRCRKEIEKDRLIAVPYVEFCLACQEIAENEELAEEPAA